MAFAVWTFVASCIAASAAVTAALDNVGVNSCAPGTWALTFDDGPAQFTPTVLKHLADAGDIKATFFVIGKQLEDPVNVKYLQDAFAAGHQIASHTYTHANLSALDAAALTKEMKDTSEKIAAAIGKVPSYMRPPFGECAGECPAVMEKMGYKPAIWNIDSRDWTHAPGGENADNILKDITRYLDGQGPVATPTDPQGVISLSHDIHGFSVDRLPQVIEYIKSQGFKFATVADCASDGRPPAYKDAAPSPAGGATPSLPAVSAVSSPAPAISGVSSPAPAISAVSSPAPTASGISTAYGSGYDMYGMQAASPTPTSGNWMGMASPTPASGDAYGSSYTSGAMASPTAAAGASPSPAAASALNSDGKSDSSTVGNVVTDATSDGVVSRPGLLVVAPVTALLGFARML